MTRLRSCEGCSRHVFVTERVCPFCKRELGPAAAPAVQFASGMSRAQRLALAAALASPGVAAAGCTKTTTPGPDMVIAGATAQGGAGAGAGGTRSEGVAGMPVYGAPVPVYGVPVSGSPGLPMGGTVAVPPYGAPVAGTPGTPMDAGPAPDDDAGVAVPVYGAPPLPQE